MKYQSTKVIELGSVAFRQWRADGCCRFVHGYQVKAKIWIEAVELDERNWVYPFGDFKQIRKDLQDMFDHKLVVAEDDPLLEDFKQLEQKGGVQLTIIPNVGCERFAEYIFEFVNKQVRKQTKNRCYVRRVEIFEHDVNSGIYEM